MDSDAADLGFGKAEGRSAFVEICLDQDLALEEQKKADRKRMEEVASWDAARRAMSPFPKPYPIPPVPPSTGG